MQWTAETSQDQVVVTLIGEKRKSTIFHMLGTAVFIAAIHFLVYRSSERLIGESIGFLWAFLLLIRQQFGKSVITVKSDSIVLSRTVLGVGRNRQFPRMDVERLGYEPANGPDDSALALMARTVMMPMRFAHGITPDEANCVFAMLHSCECWIAGDIRPVGTAMF